MKEVSQTPVTPTNQRGFREYKIKGVEKTIIARKGGPTTKDVKEKPSYQKLRNNQKEFGVASMMAKALRSSLSDGMSEICESYVSSRLTAQFRNLAKMEAGETGTRPMCISKHGHIFHGFEFNPDSPYKEIFGAKYFVRKGSRQGQVIIHFPAFIPEETFKTPKEATNFKITARLVALSDYEYDTIENSYHPKNKDMHGKFGSFESAMLPLLKIPTEPMTAQVSIPFAPEIGEEMGYFLVMAVSFFKYQDGTFSHLPRQSGMQIEQVY